MSIFGKLVIEFQYDGLVRPGSLTRQPGSRLTSASEFTYMPPRARLLRWLGKGAVLSLVSCQPEFSSEPSK